MGTFEGALATLRAIFFPERIKKGDVLCANGGKQGSMLVVFAFVSAGMVMTRLLPGFLGRLSFPAQRRSSHKPRDLWLGVFIDIDGNDQVGILGQFRQMVPLDLMDTRKPRG